MLSISQFLNNSIFFVTRVHVQCCLHRWSHNINLVDMEMCIFSEFIDMSELLSSCLSRSFMFWTTFRVYYRFPEACCTEYHPDFLVSFFPSQHLRVPCTHRASKVTRITFVPQIRFHVKRDNVLLLSLLAIQAKSFPEIFSTSQIAFLRKEKNECWNSGCRKMWCRSWCWEDATSCATHHAWNFLLLKMSASWCFVLTYLIKSFGSRLILSNNQSRATRWVRDTCLIVGLMPLMILFITASLSSKMYNWLFLREMCVRKNLFYVW